MTIATMTRNQTDPTRVTRPVLFAAELLNRLRVTEPAGSEPATMKMVAEITSDQPAIKPSPGCRTLATQA
jgi:hypothetical protein